jgi:uncharacterized protein YlxW (UPF0749 family)
VPAPEPTASQPRRAAQLAWHAGVPIAAAVAGFLFVTSSISADGTDLRGGTTDLPTLLNDRERTVGGARAEVRQLRSDVQALTASVSDIQVDVARERVAELQPAAGLTEIRGRGLRIALDDAPREVIEDSALDPNLLIVHQQDIQAFVNALWASGASGISLQGQRLISTTGIKCVGNTVLLHGMPYSPPYRINAVGDPDEMFAALAESPGVAAYQEFVRNYELGLSVEPTQRVVIPAYDGSPRLESAQPLPG